MKNLEKQVISQLKNLQNLEKSLYNRAKAIIQAPGNYHEGEGLSEALPCAVQLVEKTGNSPHFHLQAIHDVTDEDNVHLYPFSSLKAQPRAQIENLFHISLMIFGAVRPDQLAATIAELENELEEDD